MIGGQTIGRIVLEDIVTILLNLPDGEMVVLKHIRHPTDHTVRSAGIDSGVRIIGIEAANRIIVTPGDDERLFAGDAVIAVGNTEQLKKFVRLLS